MKRHVFRLVAGAILAAAAASAAATPSFAAPTRPAPSTAVAAASAPGTTGSFRLVPAAASPRGGAAPNARLTGSCGTINFVNNGNGNFVVAVFSTSGVILWEDWTVSSLISSTGGTRFPPMRTVDGWAGHVAVPPFPQGLLLTGRVFTTGGGTCLILPNPA